MSIFKTVVETLGTPDNQGRDWYAWSTNQCSHALFGVFVALLFPGAEFQMAVIFAALKETFDFMRKMDADTAKDSLIDIIFWLIGASVIALSDHVLGMIFMFFGLVIGIIPRIRKVLKDAPDIE